MGARWQSCFGLQAPKMLLCHRQRWPILAVYPRRPLPPSGMSNRNGSWSRASPGQVVLKGQWGRSGRRNMGANWSTILWDLLSVVKAWLTTIARPSNIVWGFATYPEGFAEISNVKNTSKWTRQECRSGNTQNYSKNANQKPVSQLNKTVASSDKLWWNANKTLSIV